MLVIHKLVSRRDAADEGAVLVTVVVVMLIGFVIATLIAASVLSTIQSNASNKRTTQAFVSAESGRDVAVKNLRSSIGEDDIDCAAVKLTDDSDLNNDGVSDAAEAPFWEYSIWTSGAATRPPLSKDSGDWAAACPTTASKWVWIESTGWQSDGAVPTTTDSVYPWYHGPATQPAGTLAYFEGKFTATKSTYVGDLVIREAGDYQCNNGASGAGTVQGDLWVLNGGLTTTSDCTVTGSIYAKGTITVKNKNFTVGGDVISVEGDIHITAGNVSIGGEVHAAGDIDTKNGSGIVDKSFRAGKAMIDYKAADWKRINGSAVPFTQNEPAPVISPTLPQVYDATSWIELTSTTKWNSDTEPFEPHPGLCSAAALKPVLETSGMRTVIDVSSCGTGTIVVDIGNINLARDALIYVPSTVLMDLQFKGTVNKAASAADPQLFVVHGDANSTDDKPTCTAASASAKDKLTVSGVINVRTMIYSACGIPQTMALTMNGQLYMGNDGLHLNGGTFTCKPMSWKPTLEGLSCGVKGEGGIFDPTNTETRLDNLAFQTER